MYRMKTYRFLIYFIIITGLVSCSPSEREVLRTDADYQQAVADFYMSLGASQTDQARFAFNKMNDVAQAFPEESAAWANLAVFAMRQGNFDLATDRIGRALDLSPEHEDVLFLAAIIGSRRGDMAGSIAYLRRAIAVAPHNIRIRFALAQEMEREDDVANSSEIREKLLTLHEMVPHNQVILMELVRLGVKEQDIELASRFFKELEDHSVNWDSDTYNQYQITEGLMDAENFAGLSLELSFLRSGLESHSRFQDDLIQVLLPPTDVGYLITEFIQLPAPEVKVAPADLDMQLEQLSLELAAGNASWVKGVTLLEDSPPFPIGITDGKVFVDHDIQLPFPGNTGAVLPVHAVTEIDYNYNFRNDLAFAGHSGFRLNRLNDDRTFTDVTDELSISRNVINGNYYGLWAFDMDMDGDLDIMLARQNGSPLVLRNNGDGTFSETEPFYEVSDVRNFLWADLTGDGAPEATLHTADGSVITYTNLRGGQFSDGITLAENVAAITVADINADSQFTIISVDRNGIFTKHRYSLRNGEWLSELYIDNWNTALLTGAVNLFVADLDNNGALDLILSDQDMTIIWLGDEDRKPVLYEADLPGGIVNIFDIDGNERLDLLGISDNLTPFHLKNEGTKNYNARSIRARASGDLGDQRINSFGIGGEMEVRSGLLYQKQLISSPIVHFGLGEHDEAQMLRIIWPNGSVQAEFAELGMGATIFNEQILKGSCPWLFANDGEEIHFITDALWRSPLGLRINAQETAGVIQTYDRVKIPGHRLNAVNGQYDLRVTAELWETHFFDYVALKAVDHPVGTEIFVDERFVFPAPDLATRVMTEPKPVARVTDDDGNDLTDIVSDLDTRYIKPFRKTPYQGLVEDHSIIIELEGGLPQNGELLILSGWLRPTDSSINLALSQGSIEPPRGLKVEVADERGGWNVLHEDYGIPAGKLKTILLDLEGAFTSENNRKVRLSTTSEIYWDGIFQAQKLDDSLFREVKMAPVLQELRYRGFSEWNRADAVSPKLPEYSQISSTAQRWRDLEGFHTRFGDVSELLSGIDDRYVIMNAGDELILHFEALDEPAEGYTRSYIFASDGWVKDGDYNTEASATVLPLPYHGQADYEYNDAGNLFNDPVFQRHAEDWVNYHTRYITPHIFRSALLFNP
jgi:tetratricopeptide (TPR) repeat protein